MEWQFASNKSLLANILDREAAGQHFVLARVHLQRKPGVVALHRTLNAGPSEQTLIVSALCLALDKPPDQSAVERLGRGEASSQLSDLLCVIS